MRQRTSQRKRAAIFLALILAATFLGIVILGTLIVDVVQEGSKWLDWEFITSFPSRFPDRAGIRSALFGTLWLMGLTALFVFPLGVGASVYLEEYAPKHWLISAIKLNISNLAGVPSIVYGILGLTIFVRAMSLERSVLAGALTIALLVLPIIIIASQEAIRAVPIALRQGAYALGATRWQTTWNIVLPQAMPGILTGTILALSRGIGETAPLIMIGALTFIAFSPTNPLDPFTVLPIQIFNWTSRPQEDFRGIAAAGIIVLLVILFVMNAGAVILRNRYQRRGEG
ncbi:phosphate ABC transporter permease PstA [SAR202 cluster bacterium AD-804-J14_MRT_500m]|nr:phosphate ABC transporter permease PstA [SAR202 cluster bacterium AD-804-J14_MRT_500m]